MTAVVGEVCFHLFTKRVAYDLIIWPVMAVLPKVPLEPSLEKTKSLIEQLKKPRVTALAINPASATLNKLIDLVVDRRGLDLRDLRRAMIIYNRRRTY